MYTLLVTVDEALTIVVVVPADPADVLSGDGAVVAAEDSVKTAETETEAPVDSAATDALVDVVGTEVSNEVVVLEVSE